MSHYCDNFVAQYCMCIVKYKHVGSLGYIFVTANIHVYIQWIIMHVATVNHLEYHRNHNHGMLPCIINNYVD